MASHSTGDGGIPKRGVGKNGLKRVMSLGGAYGTRNYTIKDLRDCKGKRTLVETLPFSTEEAAAAEEAGIDTMKVRFDPNQPELAANIRQAAPNTFMAFSVPLVAAASEVEAVRLGYQAMSLGADAIMCHGAQNLSVLLLMQGFLFRGMPVWFPERALGLAVCGQ
jgi:3-methyl-2-oxobutanoate hydroxymethyltransferase